MRAVKVVLLRILSVSLIVTGVVAQSIGSGVDPAGAQSGSRYRTAVLADNPYAYIPLTETTGASAVDASGNSRNGTYQGGVLRGQPGPLTREANNFATQFGNNAYVQLGSALVPAVGDWTVEAWIKPMGPGIGDGNVAWSQYLHNFETRIAANIGWADVSLTAFQIGDDIVALPGLIQPSSWSHVVWRRSGNSIRMFVNGVDVGGFTSSRRVDTKATEIGSQHGPWVPGFFNGQISHFAVYRTPLSGQRIQAHYAASGRKSYLKRDPRELYGDRDTSGYASDPVNTASGNYTETNVDLEFGVSGLDHARTYNAMDNRVGPLGRGWSLNSSASLDFVAGASIELNDADGRVVTFVPDGTGGYIRSEEMFADLVKLSDNSFELRYFNGETWVFDANGRLVSKSFWDGQSVAFSYDNQGQLIRATHSTGLVVDYEYENQRLVTVRSSDGRTIIYSYDAVGNFASFTDPTGAVTQYETDVLGLITKITDPNGNLVIENTYDEDGRVIHQVSGSGNATTFVYDDETGITTVGDDATYTSVRYAHDEQGRLTSITDIYGAALTKSYDASGNLVGTLDRRGATTAQTFDAHGNQLTNTEVGGIAESFEYDTADRLISSTDALGNVTRYSYEGNNRIPSAMTNAKGAVSTTEITNGLITASTDADGVKTTYGYDSMRNLISITDALGNKSSFAYDDMGNQILATTPSGHKTTTTFDKKSRVTAVEEPTGAITRYEYSPKGDLTKITDPIGAISTYSYDNTGRLVSQTEPNGAITTHVYDSHDNLIETHGPGGAITKSSFDAMGRLLSSTDATGGVTRYEYDADGNTTKVIDPLGATSSRTLDDRGREIESIDALGRVTKTEYDLLDRVIAMIDPTGAKTQTVYDAIGNVTELIDALGAKSISRYSQASRVIETIDPKGNSTTYRYDPSGRQIGVIDPLGAHTKTSYDRNGNVASTISPTGLVTKFAYDASGRQIEVRNPRGGISTTSYSLRGEVVKETDPTGASKRYSYDAVGNLITATDANGGVTKFSHDQSGNRTSMTDQLGAKSEFGYDLNGQMISKSDPLGRITTFAYDPRGLLRAIVDPSGRSETRTYDAIGQLITRTFGDGSSVSFVYDQAGRRTKMTDSTGTMAYGYDAVGRLISRTYPDGSVVSSTFDLVGNRSSLTYPDATTATYSYDGANRLVGMEHPKVGKVTYTLDLEGRLISESLPTGAKTKDGKWSRKYGYTDDLMTSFTDTRYTQPNTTAFGYDQAGRVTSETSKNKTKRYSYDPAGQLTKLTGPDSGAGNDLSFTYDSVGNRTTMRKGNQETKYVYDPAKQLTSASTNGKTTKYSYDQAGRRIKEQLGNHSVTSTYDQTGALSSIVTTNGNETIRKETRAYDGDGVLVRSTTEEQSDDDDDDQMITENRFRWDTNTGVPEILTIDGGSTSSASISTDLFYGYGRIAAFGKNKLTMFSKDAYGSTISIEDDDQFVRASSYDPWGNPSKGNDEDDEDKSSGLSFGYRSELHLGDEDIYLRARNYDPTTGRFTTVDPLDGVVGELTVANPYHYANNDPLNQVDPLGLRPATDEDFDPPTTPTLAPKQSAYPRLPAVSYEDARAASKFFRFKPRSGYGTVEVSFFIQECLVLGLTEGDCRGFSKAAGPTNSRAFVSLDFETGSGYIRVNPSCIDKLAGRECFDAFEIGGNFIGSPALRKKNRFLVDQKANGLDLSFGLANSSAVATLGPIVPAITSSLDVTLHRDGIVTAIRTGDKYPSIEIYQRLRDGTLRTVLRENESRLPGGSGPICLTPGVNQLC